MADLPQQQWNDQKGGGDGPSTSQILAVLTLLPVSGTLFFLASVTLGGTLVGLAVTTPLFVICSPVLVPTAFVIGLAVLGFLASGAFGITAVSSMSWTLNCFRRMRGSSPQQMEQAKETTGQLGQKAGDMGWNVQNKAQAVTGFKLDIHEPTILELFDGWHT